MQHSPEACPAENNNRLPFNTLIMPTHEVFQPQEISPMRFLSSLRSACFSRHTLGVISCFAVASCVAWTHPSARAAIVWDAEAGTHWWFNPVNWNTNSNINTALPPSNGQPAPSVTDAQINLASGAWDLGEGVVYDPANDPHFAAAAALSYPAGYGPQTIAQLYMSRNTTNTTLLTIKGDIEARGGGSLGWTIGRSSGIAGVGTSARVNQISGTVRIRDRALDLGTTDTSNPGYGNGTWDYRGGILDVSRDAGQGIRLSPGGSAGTGGIGRFIMHNPTTPGYVRTYSMNIAAHAATANGTTNGVGIVEFHYENGGTRPIQVVENLTINNGMESGGQVRSARLELVLHQAPCTGAACIPQDIGLFDVDFFDPDQLVDPIGTITGSGTNARLFSNADGSVVYTPGSIVSANFGSTQYHWTISYTGNITWVGTGDTGVVASISGSGGTDIVLIGHSSVSLGLTGDFNNDGKVDAADYVHLRKNNAPAGDFAAWRANFGAMAGSGAGSGAALGLAAVPEPATVALTFMALGGGILFRRRRS